jgi:tetratricopeptide (TPR) repeat protein
MLFLKFGSTNQALKYLNQAVVLDVHNVEAWRGLAEAQFRAGKYTESVSSYRRVLSVVGDDPNFDSIRLEYARALRLSGNSEEARGQLERTSRSTNRSVSASAKRQLREAASEASHSGAPAFNEVARAANPNLATNAANPRWKSVQKDPRSVRAIAANSPDSLFVEGMRIVGGRKPKILQRAELVRALELFQYAAQNGNHRSEAARYAELLGKEYDRRKNWR